MNNIGKLLMKMGLLSLLSVMPLAAQMHNGVDFTASSPFYAGDAKLSAGNYKVFQPDMNIDILQVQSIDGLHSVFVRFIPTRSVQLHRDSAVTFEKYGDTDHLNRLWIQGQEYGIRADSGQVETKTAADANAARHSPAASGQ